MRVSYSTAEAAAVERKRLWDEAVSRTYFPLELTFRNAPRFAGALDVWTLGKLSISRNVSDGLLYRRHERHLLHEREENYLVTIPERSEIRFKQDGKDVQCRPGAFLIERSHLPYDFSYAEPNALWVLKVPSATLRARIRQPERLATLRFDATPRRRRAVRRHDPPRRRARRRDGRGRLRAGRPADRRSPRLRGRGRRPGAGEQIGLDPQRASAPGRRFICRNLSADSLSPQTIAQGCGISVRYLHQLFETEGTTVGAWIRRQRSCSAPTRRCAIRRAAARSPRSPTQWGFADQAQFSRRYRAEFRLHAERRPRPAAFGGPSGAAGPAAAPTGNPAPVSHLPISDR